MKSSEIPDNLKWNALLQTALTEPGILSTAFRQFHDYSFGNVILAYCQCKMRGLQFGPIAPYNRWKELGRYVMKGQKAIMLCMPITVKTAATDTDIDTDGDTNTDTGLRTVFVYRNNWFVLSQTDGQDFSQREIPGWDANKALDSLQVKKVPFEYPNGNCQGYAEHKNPHIAINPLCQDPERTLFHELAHVVLGHTKESRCEDTETTPKNLREIEAEAVAMIVCDSLGFPGAEYSRGYIQNWGKGIASIPEKSAMKIFKAADAILKAGKD